MFRRREGFTLIELLVVIAIIGILASMVFPVFARARESARKVVCLSNVKNIALAFQMYLGDYGAFMPNQHQDAYVDNIFAINGCGDPADPVDGLVQPWSGVQTAMNPYLRAAVILDEYVKNRDVWNCPSAKFLPTAAILPTWEATHWIDVYNNHWGDWGGGWSILGPCRHAFPPGWGGAVTDSFVQGFAGMAAEDIAEKGAFLQTIGTSALLRDLKDTEIDDAVGYLVCGDSGFYHEIEFSDRIAYPDRLGIALSCWRDTSGNWDNPDCGVPGVGTSGCGVDGPEWSWDAQLRKESNASRHLGGVNVGFADGHARWINSETVLWCGEDWRSRCQPEAQPLPLDRPITGGIKCCGLRSVAGRPDPHF